MANKNKESTRYYSEQHENSVCKALGARRQSNSGAGDFQKGDCVTNNFLIECKTTMKDKDSFSVKKEWLEKNKTEAFLIRKRNNALCFNFGPKQNNYYIIDERLMKYLVEKLEEDNQ